MGNTVIINAVEASAALPVKTALLKEEPQRFRQWAESFSADELVIAAHRGSEAAALLRETGYEVLELDGTHGLVCQEPSAMVRAWQGEKPYPGLYTPRDGLQVANMLDLIPDADLVQYACAGLPEGCVVARLLALVKTLSVQACGKCVFCREGLGQMHEILFELSDGRGSPNDLDTLLELAGYMAEQTACGFGVRFGQAILAFLQENQSEFEAHTKQGTCPSACCPGLSFYKILGSKCVGCGECIDCCPEDAITGKDRFIHVINDRNCIRCGKCLEACEEGAIIRCSADNKPVCPVRPVPVGSWKR